jgi:hypothetical protein
MLFRLSMAVSLALGFLLLLLVAFVGFALIGGARPGWTVALRRKGKLGDAFLRAAIAAAGAAGIARWARVIFSRVPSLYEPDPSLPGSLESRFPSVDVLWGTARGTFILAAIAAAAALALKSQFFRSAAGRALGVAALLVALLPSGSHSAAEFVSDALPTVLAAAWLAASAALLLREHAAAWLMFGLLSLGLRDAMDLAGQPAAADRVSGAIAIVLLVAAAIALLAGRRDEEPPEIPTPVGPPETWNLEPETPSTTPSSDTA